MRAAFFGYVRYVTKNVTVFIFARSLSWEFDPLKLLRSWCYTKVRIVSIHEKARAFSVLLIGLREPIR